MQDGRHEQEVLRPFGCKQVLLRWGCCSLNQECGLPKTTAHTKVNNHEKTICNYCFRVRRVKCLFARGGTRSSLMSIVSSRRLRGQFGHELQMDLQLGMGTDDRNYSGDFPLVSRRSTPASWSRAPLETKLSAVASFGQCCTRNCRSTGD